MTEGRAWMVMGSWNRITAVDVVERERQTDYERITGDVSISWMRVRLAWAIPPEIHFRLEWTVAVERARN